MMRLKPLGFNRVYWNTIPGVVYWNRIKGIPVESHESGTPPWFRVIRPLFYRPSMTLTAIHSGSINCISLPNRKSIFIKYSS